MIQQTPMTWWQLIAPVFLILIYAMLSYLAFFDQTFFFESMDMPSPNHDFLIWSWGGKNTALLVALILGTLSRDAKTMYILLVALLVMQVGDINAGLRTNVNVFITYIAMGFVLLEFIALGLGRRLVEKSKLTNDGS